jgi:hypothetical protein
MMYQALLNFPEWRGLSNRTGRDGRKVGRRAVAARNRAGSCEKGRVSGNTERTSRNRLPVELGRDGRKVDSGAMGFQDLPGMAAGRDFPGPNHRIPGGAGGVLQPSHHLGEEADHLGGSGGADGPDTEEANLRRRKSQGAPPVTQAPRST